MKTKFYMFFKYLLVFVYYISDNFPQISYINMNCNCELCAVVAILHFQKVITFVALSSFILKNLYN